MNLNALIITSEMADKIEKVRLHALSNRFSFIDLWRICHGEKPPVGDDENFWFAVPMLHGNGPHMLRVVYSIETQSIGTVHHLSYALYDKAGKHHRIGPTAVRVGLLPLLKIKQEDFIMEHDEVFSDGSFMAVNILFKFTEPNEP